MRLQLLRRRSVVHDASVLARRVDPAVGRDVQCARHASPRPLGAGIHLALEHGADVADLLLVQVPDEEPSVRIRQAVQLTGLRVECQCVDRVAAHGHAEVLQRTRLVRHPRAGVVLGGIVAVQVAAGVVRVRGGDVFPELLFDRAKAAGELLSQRHRSEHVQAAADVQRAVAVLRQRVIDSLGVADAAERADFVDARGRTRTGTPLCRWWRRKRGRWRRSTAP